MGDGDGLGRRCWRSGPQPRDLTWREPRRLPDGILGPIRAKPVLLDSNTLLAGSSTEDAGWRAHVEIFRATSFERRTTSSERRTTSDEWLARVTTGSAWTKTPPLNTPKEFGAIQPTILVHSPSRLQILCRTEQGVIAESWSSDGGATWSAMKATRLPNPSAGIDVVKLANGLFVLAYNPSVENRRVIALATSRDGVAWSAPVTIEEGRGEYSYPAIIQTQRRPRPPDVHVAAAEDPARRREGRIGVVPRAGGPTGPSYIRSDRSSKYRRSWRNAAPRWLTPRFTSSATSPSVLPSGE